MRLSWRRAAALVASVATLLAPAVASVTPLPARALATGIVTAGPSPTWQANDDVNTVAVGNGVVYIGGRFTSVRPPGAAAGSGDVARHQIAAFDAVTGDLVTSFDPDIEPYSSTDPAVVSALTVSPDGSRLYVGGSFYSVNGKRRADLAVFDTATGALLPWNASGPNGQVKGIAVAPGDGTVYVGGRFTKAGGQARTNLAAYTPSGDLLPWAPEVDAGSTTQTVNDGTVRTLRVSPDGSEVVIGGEFRDVNYTAHQGIEAVDPVTGANIAAWGPGPKLSQYFTVFHMVGDADALYIGGVDNGGRYGAAEFDGTAALNWADGTVRWRDNCQGDTVAVALLGGVLYSGSHVHDCSGVPNGFGSTLPVYHHLLAESAGDGTIQPWWPNTDAGSSEGDLGPTDMASDGSQVFLVGTFQHINGAPAQGFTRFEFSPDRTYPTKVARPSAAVVGTGTIQVTWYSTTDIDDSDLTYYVYRDGDTAPVGTVPAHLMPWQSTTLQYVDSNVPPGPHYYQVVASDGTNTSFRNGTSNTVDASVVPSTYDGAVEQSGPWAYWRLDEPAGATTAADSSTLGNTGAYSGGLTFGVPGALQSSSDPAVAFDGSTGNVGSSPKLADPQTFSVEAWFETTSKSGGKIVGFGGQRTGTSSNYDRHVYLTNDGHVIFGAVGANGSKQAVKSPAGGYNKGSWHYVVATLGSQGMALYIDGARVATNANTVAGHYSGYWRVGGDNLKGWPSAPASNYLAGSIDEVAIYAYPLTLSQVSQHYALR